jgi:putative salt-induced outer membrane protein
MMALALATLICVPALVLAEDAAEEAAEPAWTGDLGLAYVATSGNSDSSSLGLGLKMERVPDPWGLSFEAKFDRAESDDELTAERYFAGIKGLRTLNERWSLFAGLSAEKDEFAGYELLALLEFGATYKALMGPKHLLDFDIGVTYTDESRVEPEPDVDYLGALLGLSYEWKISDNASFTERLIYYPNFDESNDWRLSSDTGVQAALSERLALKLSYEVRYRNRPIGDNDDTDTATKVSVVLKL